MYHISYNLKINFSQHFYGREELINQIKSYLKSQDSQKPLVLYGESGTGKSALAAKISKEVKSS